MLEGHIKNAAIEHLIASPKTISIVFVDIDQLLELTIVQIPDLKL